MNDFYQEILVKKQGSSADLLKKAGLIALTVLSALAGLFVSPLFIILAIGFGVLSWFLITGMDIEYEYLYVNGDIDVDKIMNKQRRKRVGSFALEDMEIIAPANSHELDSWRSRVQKVRDFSSGRSDAPAYMAVYHNENSLQLVRFEFGKDIVQDMRRLAPRKVSRDCFF